MKANPKSQRRALAAIGGLALLGLSASSWAALGTYTQDFEALDAANAAALTGDGWKVFGNVSDSTGAFLFGYGTFGAPNGGAGFSGIIDGQGGVDQGAQQLSIYNDYNCCQPSNGHFNGTDLVEANVFQEQFVGASDLGTNWVFKYNAKRGDIAGTTTAVAFIKVLDFVGGTFATLAFPSIDMTNVPADWVGYEINIAIDPAWEGQLLQFGFASTASNFQSSQIIYDNVAFEPAASADTDGDGVNDDTDNCTLVANADQRDTNGDGIGNACDADLNGDCGVNFGDLGGLKAAFNPNPYNPDADFNGDGGVNFGDLAFMKSTFFNGANPGPGPGAPGNACE